MKKLFQLGLACLICASFSACSSGGEAGEPTQSADIMHEDQIVQSLLVPPPPESAQPSKEENQCVGAGGWLGSPSPWLCCSGYLRWYTGSQIGMCCFPSNWQTPGGEYCCSGSATYTGSGLVCR